MNDTPIFDLKSLYEYEQKTVVGIAELTGMAEATVRRHLIKLGVTLRTREETQNLPQVSSAKKSHKRAFPKDPNLTEEKLKDMYLNEGKSLADLVKLTGLYYKTIQKRLVALGATMRSPKERQNVPSVSAAKSARQKEFMADPVIKARQIAGTNKAWTDGREAWQEGLTKETDSRIAKGAEATSRGIQKLWDNGHYNNRRPKKSN